MYGSLQPPTFSTEWQCQNKKGFQLLMSRYIGRPVKFPLVICPEALVGKIASRRFHVQVGAVGIALNVC